MKFLITILSFIIVEQSCNQKKIYQNSIELEYTAISRGIFKKIILNNKTISVFNKQDSIQASKPCDDETWKLILEELHQIDIKNILNLKAPSEKRFFDGAAIGNFKISYNGKTYETPSFDHGNPPKEIAQLVKEMLSISENIE